MPNFKSISFEMTELMGSGITCPYLQSYPKDLMWPWNKIKVWYGFF